MWPRAGAIPALTLVLSAGLVVLQPHSAAAQQPNIDFSVTGTSTVRGWTCTAKGVVAVTPGTGSAQPVSGFAKGVQSATVTVQVKAFVCPNDEMMQHLLETMKADKFADIVYRLERYEVTGSQVQAIGTMTMTGVSQPLSFPLGLKPSPQGVQVDGSTRLDMTKFGIDPPTVMLGMLKVGPQIRIEFKGLVAP